MKSDMSFKIKVDTTELDEGIEKANQLVELLKKASELINSLSQLKI